MFSFFLLLHPFSLFENHISMTNPRKPKKKPAEAPAKESLEQIIENSKVVADAYRKILNSLESKLKK